MKKNEAFHLLLGMLCLLSFVIWTLLIQTIDVQPVGPKETSVGFSSLNVWFHRLTGVHMTLYVITDWLSLIPLFLCLLFGLLGLTQWIQRRSLFLVDRDLILLGVYDVLLLLSYLLFEIFPINYRPVLIEGRLEPSYPSSTTLLVLGVMPTLSLQSRRRIQQHAVNRILIMLTNIFSVYMVIARLVSGVHWITDIAGSLMLSAGLFHMYQAAVLLCCKENN